MSTGNLADQLARNKVPDSHGSAYIPGAQVLAFEEGVKSRIWLSVLQEWPRCEARVRIIYAGIAVSVSGKEVLLVIAEAETNDAQGARLMMRELVQKRASGLHVPKANGCISACRVEPLPVRGQA